MRTDGTKKLLRRVLLGVLHDLGKFGAQRRGLIGRQICQHVLQVTRDARTTATFFRLTISSCSLKVPLFRCPERVVQICFFFSAPSRSSLSDTKTRQLQWFLLQRWRGRRSNSALKLCGPPAAHEVHTPLLIEFLQGASCVVQQRRKRSRHLLRYNTDVRSIESRSPTTWGTDSALGLRCDR